EERGEGGLRDLLRRARRRRLAELLEARHLRVGQRPTEGLAPERADRVRQAAGGGRITRDELGPVRPRHHLFGDHLRGGLVQAPGIAVHRTVEVDGEKRRRGLIAIGRQARDTDEVANYGVVLPLLKTRELR